MSGCQFSPRDNERLCTHSLTQLLTLRPDFSSLSSGPAEVPNSLEGFVLSTTLVPSPLFISIYFKNGKEATIVLCLC